MKRHTFIATSLLACFLAVGMSVHAQPAASAWPERTITLIQPYAPGTATDASSRFIAQKISEKWKVPLVMDHRAGANGLIGTEIAARAAPDGYTMMITSTGYFTNEAMIARIGYDPLKSFVPVAKVGAVQLLLVVPSTSRFSNVKELVDYAKANPGKLSYASGGSGSSQHLSASLLSTLSGAQLLHVPYKGQVPAAVGTSTGEVDFSFAAITTARPLVDAGKLKILAASGAQRSASYPSVPTVAEAGLTGYEYVANTFFFAPAGTPDAIVRKMSDAIGEVARSPDYRDFAKSIGMEAPYTGHGEWLQTIASERQHWLKIVRDSGAKPE
ncbi:MAG: tripartite tricarboxylate transporter substrate binding protein [Variovorax sp.]|nr:MAG: tripartite tricarboxylate transporter substrate binding protein [Variovorax sp.]